MEKKDLIKRLTEILTEAQSSDKLSVIENADMSKYTSFRAGGKAAALVEVENKEQLKAVLRFAEEEKIPHLLLGNGSNTLFKDSGYDGLVIKLGDCFGYTGIESDGHKKAGLDQPGEKVLVSRGASMLMSTVAVFMREEGITGFEFAGGIPGSIGGAMFMNAGAYGGEMKDILSAVRVLTTTGEIRVRPADELDLSYRHSRMMEEQEIVLEARLNLTQGSEFVIRAQMEELRKRRVEKQPLEYPSAGSTFKRPEGYFAGKLIEEAGLRGYRIGDAQVSEKHCGFVINRGSASAAQILELMQHVQARVKENSGVDLEPEVRLLGFTPVD